MIELRSDNTAGVAPEILTAVSAANVGSALAYGGDGVTARLHDVVRDVFAHESARVFPVTSGTAANALSLSAATPPWGAVVCHETAHILNSEGGATSLLSGGAVMTGVPGDDFLIDPAALRAHLESVRWGDNHESQPSVLALTCPSDFGTVYTPDRVAELSGIAKDFGLRVHLDGARLANAVAALGCPVADLTWRAGVDVVSLGATKNGALSAEGIVVFDDRIADELVFRTKRAGHVSSKMRFQSAQLIAYLTDGLWLRLAENSNRRMAELAAGVVELGLKPLNRAEVNMLFVELPDGVAERLHDDVLFYDMGALSRFVTSWQTTPGDVEAVLARLRSALGTVAS